MPLQEQRLHDENGRLTYDTARALILAGEAVSIPGFGVVWEVDKLPPPEEFARGNQRGLQAAYEENMRMIAELNLRNQRIERMAAGDQADTSSQINDTTRAPVSAGVLAGAKIDEPAGTGRVAMPEASTHVSTTPVPGGTVNQEGVDALGRKTTAGLAGAPEGVNQPKDNRAAGRVASAGYHDLHAADAERERGQAGMSAQADADAAASATRTDNVSGGTGAGQYEEAARAALPGGSGGEQPRFKDEDNLPVGFPSRRTFMRQGLTRIGDVRYADDERLLALENVDDDTLDDVDAYFERVGMPRPQGIVIGGDRPGEEDQPVLTDASELPADFPARHILVKKYKTIGEVRAAAYNGEGEDNELIKMDGIAEGRLSQIREYLANVPEGEQAGSKGIGTGGGQRPEDGGEGAHSSGIVIGGDRPGGGTGETGGGQTGP